MRRLALAAVAAALLLAALPGASSAQERPSGRITLGDQTSWVRSEVPFQLRVLVDRLRGADELAVGVTVHRNVRTRSQFVRTLDGELLGRALLSQVTPLDELAFGPNGAVITVQLPRLSAGVYPVSVTLRSRRGDVVDDFTTHLVRVPDEDVELPLAVSWIQPLATTPALQPDGDRELGEEDLSRLQAVTNALAAAPSTPITLDVAPELLETIEAMERDDLLVPLRGRDVLAAPYVDLDVGALVAAGLADSLRTQRAAGTEVLERVLGTTGDARTWAIDDPIDARALGELRSTGVSRVVVHEQALEPIDPGLTGGLTLAVPFALPDGSGGTVDAAAVDPGLLAHLQHEEPVLGAHHLLADLAVLFFDAPGTERGVAILPPEGWVPDGELLRIVFRALTGGPRPIVRPVVASELFSIDPLTEDGEIVERTPVPGVDRFGIPAAEIRAAQHELATFSVLTGDEHEALPLLRRLLLVAQADGLPAPERRRYLAAAREEVDVVRGDVRLGPARTFRLTAREGTIPVTIVNDNPFPINASLVLASDKLEFAGAPDDDRGRLVISDLVLQPGPNTRTVPVKVRTSGSFPLRATLLDAAGGTELFRESYTITSTVTSGIGLVLSVGALAFLLLWWASHWRTVRRDRRLVEVAT